MRIAFLFNYPLADNTPWKQKLLLELVAGNSLFVVFGRASLLDHWRGYLRRAREDDLSSETKSRAPAATPRRRRTLSIVKELGIPCCNVSNVNDDECIQKLSAFRADYVVSALDHLLSKSAIERLPIVLNVHYGVLPDVKGWNAMEWSVLVTGRMSVSLHRVVVPVDSGHIYGTRDIALDGADGLSAVRLKCQDAALDLYRGFFRDPERAVREARPNGPGKTYYKMNWRLKRQVADMIREGRVSRTGNTRDLLSPI